MEPRGRDAQSLMFAGVMVAPRPRIVRGLNASWPRGSRCSPRRGKAANKEKAAQALRGKGPGMFASVQAPQPPGKIQDEFIRLVGKAKAPPRDLASVLAALFAGGKSGRRYRARCLGSVCFLDAFPEFLARALSRTKPSRLFRRRHLSRC